MTEEYVRQYKKQIGYNWILVRSLDRLLDAFYDIDNIVYDEKGYSTHVYLQKICVLARALYAVLPPSVKKDCINTHLEIEEVCSLEYDDLDEAVDTIHDAVVQFIDHVINALDRHNLLIPKEELLVGREE